MDVETVQKETRGASKPKRVGGAGGKRGGKSKKARDGSCGVGQPIGLANRMNQVPETKVPEMKVPEMKVPGMDQGGDRAKANPQASADRAAAKDNDSVTNTGAAAAKTESSRGHVAHTVDQLRRQLSRVSPTVCSKAAVLDAESSESPDSALSPNSALSPDSAVPRMSSGSEAVDRLLPHGGLSRHSIVHYLDFGGGAGSLALAAAAKQVSEVSGPLVVVAPGDRFYPPSAAALGIDLDRVIWIRPADRRETVWAIDQSLRCESIGGVWAVVDEHLDDRDARRIQLAAREGVTPGWLVRPAAAARRPAMFAEAAFAVSFQPVDERLARAAWEEDGVRQTPPMGEAFDPEALFRRVRPVRTATPNLSHPILRVRLDRVRGAVGGATTWIQMDDRGRPVNLAPQIIELIRRHPMDPSKTPFCTGENHGRPFRPHAASTAALRLAAELADPKRATAGRGATDKITGRGATGELTGRGRQSAG